MRRNLLGAAACAAGSLVLASCGGGSAAGPSDLPSAAPARPAETVLTLVSGETGAPIAFATVTAGGQVVNSDAAGMVRLPAGTAPGSSVEIRHPSVLDRVSALRSADARIALWPRTTASGLDENYTATLVYTDTSSNSATGGSSLLRLPQGTRSVAVVPTGPLLTDGEAMAAHSEAVAAMNQALGGAVTYSLSTVRPASGLVVETRVDPQDALCVSSGVRGYTRTSYVGMELSSAETVFCSLDVARSATVAHELGHTFGLRHSPEQRELMYSSFSNRRASTFSAREALVMRLMLDRPAGNRYPDNDRAAAASAARSVRVAVCE